jgi:anti-sigma regulatory factor (Ser/Thr protein kinase)
LVDETSGSRLGQETLRPASARKRSEAAAVPPAPEPATETTPVLLDRTFGHDDIGLLRREVRARLDPIGVDTDRLHGFVLAVNEIITNVVLHAGGHGRIVVWLTAGSVWCTVTDSGPGIPEQYHHPPEVPGALEVGGRGIWLAHQLCDEVTLASGPIGTTIGLGITYTPVRHPPG